MTTTTATAPTTAILALDLGKYESVAGLYDPDGGEARFQTIPTSRAELARLLDRHRPAVVVIEACTLAGWVYDLSAERGLACQVANTAREAWKFKHAQRKTDRDDALRLAQREALGQRPTVTIPPKATREWRALIAYRQGLVGRRVAAQDRVHAILLGQGLPAPCGHRAWTATGLEGIEQHARPLPQCGADDLWRGLLFLALTELRQARDLIDQTEAKLNETAKASEAVRILETVPGVGPRTAEAVAAHRHDPHRFQNAKQVSAYAGMVPRPFPSGESDRRGRITKRGPALLRKLLVECAWAMLRYNAWARAVYQRLSRGKARKKQAIVALARKLLVRLWALWRDRAPWRDGPTAAPA